MTSNWPLNSLKETELAICTQKHPNIFVPQFLSCSHVCSYSKDPAMIWGSTVSSSSKQLFFIHNKMILLSVSMDSGSLLMSEIVDIPDDSSPSEDSCLMEVGLKNQGERGTRSAGGGVGGDCDGGEYFSFRCPPSQTPESPLAGGPRARRFIRGERSNSCSSPSTATNTYRWQQPHIHSKGWPHVISWW